MNLSSATQMLSLEDIFVVTFSIIVYNEQITTKFDIEFVFIPIAVVISKIKLSFLRKKKKFVLDTMIKK